MPARAWIIILVVLSSVSCVSTPPPRQEGKPILFTFHSNSWLNLHHFLRGVTRGMPAPAELSETEQATWDEVVRSYTRYAERHVHFDGGMMRIKETLRQVGQEESVPEIKGEEELDDLLERAAPIYRKHWWPAHDALNRSWIAAVQPLLDRYGATIAARVSAAYGQTWTGAVPVDLTIVGGPNGAYTTSPPVHVIMPSSDRGYYGLSALEMLFHEPSHQWGQFLQGTIERAASAQKKTVPRQLWHAVLFYNAGEITRRVLAEDGYAYGEYADDRLYTILCGERCRDRIAAEWNQRLDAKVSAEDALEALVTNWPGGAE